MAGRVPCTQQHDAVQQAKVLVAATCHSEHVKCRVKSKMLGAHSATPHMTHVIQVTHDKKYQGTQAAYHCSLSQDEQSCHCTCDRHPPCCSRAGRLLRNDVLLGNKFANVACQQECCNMCTNHPHCTAWEYTATKVCALTGGKPQFVPSPSQTIATWAGLPSPHSCAPFDGSGEVSVAATASV